MVKSSFFCLCFISFFSIQAQDFGEVVFHSTFEETHFNKSSDYLAQLLMADASVTAHEVVTFKDDLDRYLKTLEAKRQKIKKEKDFVSHVFYKTHRKYLKRYTPFTTFTSLMRTGKYDCLSATSLYSQLFNELGISHSIIETNYHIYINVDTKEGNVLIESTDPIYGFVDRQPEIDERLSTLSNESPSSLPGNTYQFASDVNDRISSNELIGLQYYNQAVAAFNVQKYETSIDLLTKGLVYRTNARTIEFGLVIAQGIMQDENVEQDVKLRYVSKLQRLFHTTEALASR